MASLIKYILTIVTCIWQLRHSQYRLQKLSHTKCLNKRFDEISKTRRKVRKVY